MFNGRNHLPKYSSKIERDDNFKNGYTNVRKHGGKLKYKAVVKYTENGKDKTEYFYSNFAREAENLRIKWINKNMEKWYSSRKNLDNIFDLEEFRNQQRAKKLIEEKEIKLMKRNYGVM